MLFKLCIIIILLKLYLYNSILNIVFDKTSCHYKLKLLVLYGTKLSPMTFDLQKK